MKKLISSFVLILFIVSSVYAIANPSAIFCEEKGNEYVNMLQEDGSEIGYCKVNGELIEGWEYYRENKETDSFSTLSLDEKSFFKKNSLSQDSNFFYEEEFKEETLEEINTESVIKAAPSNFDWRNYNGKDWTTPVKNQGDCGSCWAFSSVSIIETRINKDLNNENYNADLSEQDLVSCGVPLGYSEDAGGCNGIKVGDSNLPFVYTKNTGIVKDSCLGYSAIDSTCSKCANSANEKLKITNYAKASANAGTIKSIISTQGPITAYLLVLDTFYSYGGGIYNSDGAKYYEGIHSISIVGYNDVDKYWIVKNSWGSGWGESGYFRIDYSENDFNYNDGWFFDDGELVYDPSHGILFLDDSYYVTGTDITTNPAVSSFTASTSYNKSNVPISFSINFIPKSLKYLSSVKINDISMNGNLQTGGIFTLSRTGSEFGCTGETTCSLTATATDDAGKTATASKAIKVDDLAPRVTNFQINNQSYFVKGSQILTFNVKVEDADINSVKLNDIEMSRSGTSYSLTKTPSQLGCSEDGLCKFNTIAIDKIGNENDSLYSEIYIDDVLPTISSVNLDKTLSQTGEKVFVLVNSTDNTGVSSVTVEGTNLEKSGEMWEGNIFLKSTPLDIIITDFAGNILTNNSLTYILDDTPPNLISNLTYNSQNISQNNWYNHDLNLSLNASDENGISKIEWRYANQNSWNLYLNILNFSESVEKNKIIFRAIDEAGNIAPSKIVNVKLDKISPEIEKLSLNLNKTDPSGEIIIFVNTFDNLSGIKEIKATLNEINYTDFEKTDNGYQTSLNTPRELGEYTIYLSVEDNAGNTNENNIKFEVINNFPLASPSIPSESYFGNNTELRFTLINVANGTYKLNANGEKNITNETEITFILNESSFIIFNLSNEENNFYENFSYFLDKTNPRLTIRNLPVLFELNGTYRVEFDCSDENSRVKNITFYVDGEIFENISSGINFYELDTLRLSNSKHNLKFVCYDYFGNFNESENITVSINNPTVIQSTEKGQVSFETTEFGKYLKTITSINSSDVQLSILLKENIQSVIPSSVNKKIIYFNISASAQYKSKVYFTLPKSLISGVSVANLKLWEKHQGDLTFNGPKSINLVEEREDEYFFYFETDRYSEFLVGEQKSSSSGGGSGGGGGGGGGGSTAIIKENTKMQDKFIDQTRMKERNTLSLYLGEKINFELSNNINHSLTINQIEENKVNLTIASEPININLEVGEEIKLNLNDDNYLDLYIKIESILGTYSNITVQEINEQVIKKEIEKTENKSKEKIVNDIEPKNSKKIIFTMVTVLVFLLLIYFIFKNKERIIKSFLKKPDKKKNKKK